MKEYRFWWAVVPILIQLKQTLEEVLERIDAESFDEAYDNPRQDCWFLVYELDGRFNELRARVMNSTYLEPTSEKFPALTPEEFRLLVNCAPQDPDLRETIEAYVKADLASIGRES